MIQKSIDQLVELIALVPSKLLGIDDSLFILKETPEKWSKKEILGHLIDSATNNHQRFIRAQFENAPTIWYHQNHWVEKSNYQTIDKHLLINFWKTYNMHLVHIISNIGASALLRTCKMQDGTEVTIEFLFCDYVAHLVHHLNQILPPEN